MILDDPEEGINAMTQPRLITGPTFAEMLEPSRIRKDLREKALATSAKDPLDPINLYNISWKDGSGRIYHEVLPRELTGVETPIVVLYGRDFPTGSHKVGATYSVLIEKAISGVVDPASHTIVWPSTGNFGIGGAWVGSRMQFDSVVILPEQMSKERFEIIRHYGARLELTPGCESSVKEIYDKCHELRRSDPERIRIMNQFEDFANYRFHYYVTGNTIIELARVLENQGIGKGVVSAYVSAMGSAGTIAAGDRLKQHWPGRHLIVGLEPIQCPTLYWNGYGGHDIQGIGDKHVTWIHNVMNMDAVMGIDDMETKLGLQLLTEEPGWEVLTQRYGIPGETVQRLSRIFGISGVCNVLGAIKTAKFYGMGRDDLIVTICTDAIDRYHSVMASLNECFGPMDRTAAEVRLVSIFHRQKLDWIDEGARRNRNQWHNLKYFTWVEQQGKSVGELDAQRGQDYWEAQQARVEKVDRLIEEYRDQGA
jgi:cysteine synthase